MRIRSIKPEFLRHKGLQKLERDNPGLYPMLVFSGLWCASDRQGVFAWDSDYLHLDILPFIHFEFEETLSLLQKAGEIERFESGGKVYGYIPGFATHQRISGEEAKQQPKYPAPPTKKQEGSRKEAGEKQEGSMEVHPSCPGKGNGVGEREREREGISPESPPSPSNPKEMGAFESFAKSCVDTWNSAGIKPPFRFITTLNLTAKEREGFIVAHGRYTPEEIQEAILNYAKIRASPDHEAFPRDYSLPGFLATGVGQYLDDAGPFDRCRKGGKAPESGPPAIINGYDARDRTCEVCGGTITGTLTSCPRCGWAKDQNKDDPEMQAFYKRNLERKRQTA